MPPPSSFIVINTIPFTQLVTQAMFNVANVQWFKYTATVPIVLGMQTTTGGTFSPVTRVYQSDGTTPLPNITSGIYGHWKALNPIGDYYIEITDSPSGGPSDFDFTFSADTRPLDVISIIDGDILVNDDTNPLAATVLSNAGSVKFFVSAIPAGESGAILPSNVSFWHDDFGYHSSISKIAVFDANLAYITSVACGLTGSNKPRFGTDITNSKVYVVNQSRELWTINSTGVATNTGYIFDLDATKFPDVIAVNQDGTKLYWFNTFTRVSGIIHTLNLTTFTALPDLYTIPGYIPTDDYVGKTPFSHHGDMFVMPNGNVVTWWWSELTGTYHLIVINSSGTLLYNYDYAPPVSIDHLAYINGDSDHILIWLFTSLGMNIAHFGRLTLATGVIDQDFTVNTFSVEENEVGIEKFGPSSSCTFVRLKAAVVTPPDKSGVYFANPSKKHDTYYTEVKKIPNPTIRTALVGE